MIKNRKHRNANGKNVLFTHKKKSANILPAPGGVIGSSGNKKKLSTKYLYKRRVQSGKKVRMSAGGENSCTSPIISVVATDKFETSASSHILSSFS
jgi:hypothetical protein